MISLIFTFDYELYGDGCGEVSELIIEPTRRLIEISNEFGAKVTIFAEAAEFIAMRKIERFKEDVLAVENQLQNTVKQGHDVQLHIHPQWFGAEYKPDGWHLNYSKYSIADIDRTESSVYLKRGIEYLESLLRTIYPDYKCIAFRAGNWCMTPSVNIIKALRQNGIVADTSVYKWGRETTEYYSYDYTSAYSNMRYWLTSENDINQQASIRDDATGLLEIPIYTEKASIFSMATMKRLKLKRCRSAFPMNQTSEQKNLHKSSISLESRIMYPKKFDFCKLTFSEMKKMLKNIVRENREDEYLPVCAIGHSKDFHYPDDYRRLLKYIRDNYFDIIIMDTFSGVLRTLTQSETGLSDFRAFGQRGPYE